MLAQPKQLLFALCITLIFRICICRINTNVSVSMNFGAGAMLLKMRRDFHWGDEPDANLVVRRHFSLEEAMTGAEFTVDVIRTVVRKDCEVSVCRFCNGSGIIRKESVSTAGNFSRSRSRSYSSGAHKSRRDEGGCVHSLVDLPCPYCLGAGVGSRICNAIFRQIQETTSIRLEPRHVRPGHVHQVKGKGHELYRNTELILGDLLLHVDSVGTGNFSVSENGDIEIRVQLSAWQALYGFTMSTPVPLISRYNKTLSTREVEKEEVSAMAAKANSTVMRIDRSEKTTLPGSTIRVGGRGLPPTGSLIVNFELEPEPTKTVPAEEHKHGATESMCAEGEVKCDVDDETLDSSGLCCRALSPTEIERERNKTATAETLQTAKLLRDAAARRILVLLQARLDRQNEEQEQEQKERQKGRSNGL
jgi:DnaJ-class molecular chaperone